MDKQWKWQWKTFVVATKVPGLWKRKEGGHLVRARILDPTTGAMREIKKVLPNADEAEAFLWLRDEKARIKRGLVLIETPKTRFCDFSVSLLERKIVKGKIRSARGRERWRHTLTHLIAGTMGVAGFGNFFVDQIRANHIEEWQVGIARLITAGEYSPVTANGWLAILKVILKAAKRELGLATNPSEETEAFDTSTYTPYTEEQPNSLVTDEAQKFLACMYEQYPQHYAMTFVGIALGLRPSTLRPLRRSGPTPDILWSDCVILVRRSHTLGQEIMDKPKTGLRQRITVPAEIIDVLRWHVETQLETPEQEASDLLFPREDGGLRTESCLTKAFNVVGQLVGLKKRFTPSGMRRTFNDLARAANVESIVTKSISGHQTDRMKEHYSTVSPVEQRESIGRMLKLVKTDRPASSTASGAPGGAPIPASGAPTTTAAS